MLDRVEAPIEACRLVDDAIDEAVRAVLVSALIGSHVGICLCDDLDDIRFVNDTFRTAVFPDLPESRSNFADALAQGVRTGRGIKLDSLPLDAFVDKVKERRRTGPERVDFSADMADGSWWRISDYRLPNGWTLALAMNISQIKNEEFRLREAHASALQASQTDWLTGLANRGCGMEQAEAALREARLHRKPVTVALVDIDHFKRVNDTYGHHVGDRVLVHFARFLKGRLSKRHLLSRIGGEEFLLVMPGTSPVHARRRIELLLHTVPPLETGLSNAAVPISFSAGLARAIDSEGLSALLGRADVALYAAKAAGRGRVETSRDPASRRPPRRSRIAGSSTSLVLS